LLCAKSKRRRGSVSSEGVPIEPSLNLEEGRDRSAVLGCFDKFDKDHDGYLDFDDIASLLRYTYVLHSGLRMEMPASFYRDVAETLIRRSGHDEESRISREDFYRIYKEQ
jgi:Ca2+-binding EF-hand superfamily protein